MPDSTEKTRKAQGKRVRNLRNVLDLSRPKFAAQHPRLSKSSIRNWEEGEKSGLSEKGASYLVAAAQRLGVTVNEEWLLTGAGKSPEKSPINLLMADEPLAFELAVQVITQKHPQTLSAMVKNGDLRPHLHTGEYVLGTRLPGNKVSQALNKLSIVETIEGDVLIGYIRHAPQGHYCLQTDTDAAAGTAMPVNILSAAPIMIVLRKFADF